MLGLTRKDLLVWVAVLAVAASALAVLAGCGGTTGASLAPGGEVAQGTAPESPAVVLGGYTFGSTSDHLTHPYFKPTATMPKATWKGWGRFAGQQMTASFASGGSVAGAKTLRILITAPGETTVHQEYNYFAQDTQGNVHMLKYQEINDGNGHSHPGKLVGVAAGRKARFWLVKNSLLTAGYTWYAYEDSSHPNRKTRRFKVLSTTASLRGQTGLLQLQDIEDENGDGAFNQNWTGPDRRQDFYFQKTGVSLFGLTLSNNPAGGFALK